MSIICLDLGGKVGLTGSETHIEGFQGMTGFLKEFDDPGRVIDTAQI